ncbi:hypothetical protein SAMN05444365_1011090 [Micromonospora pattaloongensis]|uniref:Uncharacterized protein n=1 Tax=Micromonospora pattaloongensis TaxID=405436 RepID=A0A1H3I3M5_9ACTN|nr:hypothetical protein SAMN05444365_1011090 [Micromonospora pattaloongensis]
MVAKILDALFEPTRRYVGRHRAPEAWRSAETADGRRRAA